MSRVSSIPIYRASNVKASSSTTKTSTAKARATTAKAPAANNSVSRTPTRASSTTKSAVSTSRASTTNTTVRAATSSAVKGISSAGTAAAKKTTNCTSTTNQRAVSNSENAVKSAATKSTNQTTSSAAQKVSATQSNILDGSNNSTMPEKKAWNYMSDGATYGKILYGEADGPSFSLQHGAQLCNVEACMTEIGGNYDYVDWNFGVATGDVRLGIEYNIGQAEVDQTPSTSKRAGYGLEYAGFQAEASLISADIDFKFPIPFTDLKAVVGVSGKAFSFGASCYYDTDKHRLNIGASALFGGGVSIGLENASYYDTNKLSLNIGASALLGAGVPIGLEN